MLGGQKARGLWVWKGRGGVTDSFCCACSLAARQRRSLWSPCKNSDNAERQQTHWKMLAAQPVERLPISHIMFYCLLLWLGLCLASLSRMGQNCCIVNPTTKTRAQTHTHRQNNGPFRGGQDREKELLIVNANGFFFSLTFHFWESEGKLWLVIHSSDMVHRRFNNAAMKCYIQWPVLPVLCSAY